MAYPVIRQKLIQRSLLPKVLKYLDDENALVITGARQVGKTSLLYLIMQELKSRQVAENRVFYFDLEDLEVLSIINRGAKEFLQFLLASGADLSARLYVFIDEIQYAENPTNFVKWVTDHHKNVKLIVSGSSSLELRQKFKDSLAGRKVVFELSPLTFSEFLHFRGEDRLAQLVADCSLKALAEHPNVRDQMESLPVKFFANDLNRLYEEFVLYGGYPKVALLPEVEKKKTYLADVYTSYVRKDIKDLMRIDNVIAFNQLVKYLSLQSGMLLNFTDVSNQLRIARATLERYLFLLENTFVIKLVVPFFTNRRKEITKTPKVFSLDTGLRNASLNQFQSLSTRTDAGPLVETNVFDQLFASAIADIRFWRTQSKNEIDFVIGEGPPLPLEVKYMTFARPTVPRGIRSFLKSYPAPFAFVLTKDSFGRATVNGTPVLFVPVWLA